MAAAKALADAVREASETPAPPPEKLPHLAYRDKKTGAVVLPAQPVAVAETKCYDIYATPPPQKAKPDASADAPGFDLYAAYAKTPPLNDQEKETETT